MNLAAEVTALRAEVEELRETVEDLQAELRLVRRSLAGLRAGAAVAAAPPTPSSFAEGRTDEEEDDFSLISGGRGQGHPARGADSRASPSPEVARSGTTGRDSRSPSGSGPGLNWAERDRLADSIGAWVARALEGRHRGASGRDRNPLASRFWVVFRDINGLIYDPPLVFRSFGGARDLCKRGAISGDSVWLGLPSEREVSRVIAGAGLSWAGVTQP